MGAARAIKAEPKTPAPKAQQPKAQAAPKPTRLSPAELAERRKHGMVHNYWLSLKADRRFPSIWDLDPLEIADAGPNSVMLDLSKDLENPEIFVGEALRYDAKSSNDSGRQADAQALLACVLDNYRAVLEKAGPIAFEEECAGEGGRTLACFGTLFPFSSSGQAIDYVFGLLSWRDATGEAEDFALPPLAEEPEVAEPAEAPCENAVDEDVAEPAVLEEAVAQEDVASVEAAPEEAIVEELAPEIAPPDEPLAEPAVEGVLADDLAPIDPAPEVAMVDITSPARVIPIEILAKIAGDDDAMDAPLPERDFAEDEAPFDAALEEEFFEEEAQEFTVPEDALPDDVADESAEAAEPVFGEFGFDGPAGEAVFGESDFEDEQPDEVVAEQPAPEHAAPHIPPSAPPMRADPAPVAEATNDLRSHFSAFGKAVFAAVRHFTVAEETVSYGQELMQGQAAPMQAEPPPAAASDPLARATELLAELKSGEEAAPGIADMPEPIAQELIPEEAITEKAVPEDAIAEEVVAEEEALPTFDPAEEARPACAPSDEFPIADDAALEAIPAPRAVFVQMVPYGEEPAEPQSDAPLADEPVAEAAPEPGASGHEVFVQMVPPDGIEEDGETNVPFDEPHEPAAAKHAVFVPMAPLDGGVDEAEPDAAPAQEAAAVAPAEPAIPVVDGKEALAPTASAPVGLRCNQEYEGVEVSEDLRRAFAEAPEPAASTAQGEDGDLHRPFAEAPEPTAPVAQAVDDNLHDAFAQEPEPAMPAAPVMQATNHDLHKQLAVAQAIAAAAPDANYHSRATLYVALGHAYDFALAAEAAPQVYGEILASVGLDAQVQASMAPVVALVFGPDYDPKRLNEFAAALSWARRANLPAGSLAAHLEFLEASLGIVAPA